MHIDPVQIILLIIAFYVVLQVILRTTRMVANFVIFVLVLAVLMPYETRGLLGGLTGLVVESDTVWPTCLVGAEGINK